MLAVLNLLVQRRMAVLVCVATALLTLLISTGYLVDNDHGRMTITLAVTPSWRMLCRG